MKLLTIVTMLMLSIANAEKPIASSEVTMETIEKEQNVTQITDATRSSDGGEGGEASTPLPATLPRYVIYIEDLVPVGYLTKDPVYTYRYYIPVIVNIWDSSTSSMSPKSGIEVVISVNQCGCPQGQTEPWVCSNKSYTKTTNNRGQVIIPVSLDIFIQGYFVDYSEVSVSASIAEQSAHRKMESVVTNN